MSEYNFNQIEKKWQRYWEEHHTFKATATSDKPKYYAMDMFPYPSGAGLHVGHPLGYIASDIVSRYKRQKGFNVLHPMGFDSFGLPAEQYAIQTGQHPAITTEQNIQRYVEQLKNLGFSYDWEHEIRTSDPSYYKWTQWIFMQLFKSYYDYSQDKAAPIENLVKEFEQHGNSRVNAACDEDTPAFTADEWKGMNEQEQSEMLLKYRLTYLAEAVVNWCPALGTVLANDEVVGGVSERGGYPVERKRMRQWMMRITAYAERLLQGLEDIDWPEPVKEMQRNWIGKSIGAEMSFAVENTEERIKVFTTRLDTVYGVTFLVLAPEHDLVEQITTDEQRATVEEYARVAKNRSERERMADVKTVSGAFTGSYAINPFNNEKLPIYIADYVLAGYGTGAVMAVPSGDQRDWNFARHFDLPIVPISDAQKDMDKQADPTKEGRYINSELVNGLTYQEALPILVKFLEENGIGKAKINYRMRDAVFSRQRYWGEPVPVYFKDGIPHLLEESDLPLELPKIDAYLPTETGEPPLGRAQEWKYKGEYSYELSTMPGWAGSSWYWYRYMDPQNDKAFADKDVIAYWQNVDLYIGGSEHATGHLLYSRFWNKFLYDMDLVVAAEPFKKLINQGMIQGRSNFVYRIKDSNTYVSFGLKDQYDATPLHVDVNIVDNDVLDLEAFKRWRPENANAEFILEDGKYICGVEIEKMSKSKYNVVNPDDIVERYGADTLRMYEMFLGPLEQFKPWNTNGMDGVNKFLRKYWKLFYDNEGNFAVSDEAPTAAELKTLHKTIKKVEEDVERFSFNTSVSTFMICVNELTQQKSNKRAVLEPLTIILAPYAPHIAEEIWEKLGHKESISYAAFPEWKEEYLVENTFEYPVSVNGKVRTKTSFALDTPREEIEKAVLSNEQVTKFFDGKAPKKIIIVPNKIINVVV
ncbi:leucyl-tRNA synthetase [Pontibacter ummariensis]|uniref:Leucine--tRNA ligase n=1 Tax=Pontibacter ummariensis TaxID=1610492 RepID=A0A239BQQ2_9BACT|nr:leucine--tRNA ligase [Pontibacter ummariensis]PRY15701.1 leucyl-tRNA synthetase [Pontibacter ummariensis]SNS09758.1 leucyl-tRNA synthetase [Pontibacter ummariensis]